jgi:AcrR family transcriptional regulator
MTHGSKMARPADPTAKIELLQAAEAVFVQRGLDLAKVEDITQRAGRSKGAFYQHFASKEEAFRQIVDTFLARLAAQIDETIVTDDEVVSVEELLGRWVAKVDRVFHYMWTHRGLVRLLLEGGRSASFAHLGDAFFERARASVRRGLADGIQRGLLSGDLDVDIASLVVAGAYDRIARDIVRRPEFPRRDWLANAQAMALAPIIDSQVI